ncbi:RICIN domain-containing protein [Dactylosporangium sp. NPDC050588]|uniref:RICIN domain-containing protein n=1 Tax=Dactylosporangium sp. NPDC050588 TaxID=3157211 RepID=UPI0033E2C8CE
MRKSRLGSLLVALGVAAAFVFASAGTASAEDDPFSGLAAADVPGVGDERANLYQPFTNNHSGKCLEIPGGSNADGVQATQYTCNGKTHQKWRVEFAGVKLGLKYYNLRSQDSDKCLSVKGNNSANGTALIQWPCNPEDNAEAFVFLLVTGVGSGTNFVIKSLSTGKYLQVNGESLSNSAKISIWSGQQKSHFYWKRPGW